MNIDYPFVSRGNPPRPMPQGFYPEQFVGAGVTPDTAAFQAAQAAAFAQRVPFNMHCGTNYELTDMAIFGDDSKPGHVSIKGNEATITANHSKYGVVILVGAENRAMLPVEGFNIKQAVGQKNYAGILCARPVPVPARSSGMMQMRHLDVDGDYAHGCIELIEAEGLTLESNVLFQRGIKGPVLAFRDDPVPGVQYPPMLTSGSTKTRLTIEGSNLFACLNEQNEDPLILLDNVQDVYLGPNMELHHANIHSPYGLIHMQGHCQRVFVDETFMHLERDHVITTGTPGGYAYNNGIEAIRFKIELTGRAGMTSAWHLKNLGDDVRIYDSSITTHGNIDLRGAMMIGNCEINLLTPGATILADRTMQGTIRYKAGTVIPWKGANFDKMQHVEV